MNLNYLFILFIILVSCKQNNTLRKGAIFELKTNEDNIVSSKELINIDTTHMLSIDKDFVLGKFDYTKHVLFVKVESIHASKPIYLNKDVYQAFLNMFKHAKTDSVDLKIISGTRNFNEQKAIWERKWKKHKQLEPLERSQKILNYSSMPSTSRHHWGTDIDLNNLNNTFFENGEGKKIYDWLKEHANAYGFHQVYTSKENGRTGYNLERWHWSYIPLASQCLKFYNENITYKNVAGFEGSELAENLKIIPDYVNGISEAAKPKTSAN
ncbi:M15 family metallopeptidase [Changchengzhania lutea]|uniref:M15 family metallopeptidase n=1 Tax=Changchengzhania lutea TaxID=2049305 RepID=UPI001FE56424|nr:M15 family metallopeptidase [Changchengzhania lutea]